MVTAGGWGGFRTSGYWRAMAVICSAEVWGQSRVLALAFSAEQA
jgi:hypothetical protein